MSWTPDRMRSHATRPFVSGFLRATEACQGGGDGVSGSPDKQGAPRSPQATLSACVRERGPHPGGLCGPAPASHPHRPAESPAWALRSHSPRSPTGGQAASLAGGLGAGAFRAGRATRGLQSRPPRAGRATGRGPGPRLWECPAQLPGPWPSAAQPRRGWSSADQLVDRAGVGTGGKGRRPGRRRGERDGRKDGLGGEALGVHRLPGRSLRAAGRPEASTREVLRPLGNGGVLGVFPECPEARGLAGASENSCFLGVDG